MFHLSKHLQVELMGHRDVVYKLFKKLLKVSKIVVLFYTPMCLPIFDVDFFFNLYYNSVKCYPALILICIFQITNDVSTFS